MPHSVLVSQLMIKPNEWPLLPADMDVETALKILRIVTEDKKLLHGHSTPFVMNAQYKLVGFVHLIDLLTQIRPLCSGNNCADKVPRPTTLVSEITIPFAGTVRPADSILKALDIMIEHRVSLAPVIEEDRLEGIIKLSDIFNTVASILFDAEIIDQKEILMRRFSL
ncbi:MAG: CBS domain-containing protein [Syntrophaceae bacterium]|nr:CBS domain-containing protein [Syntrophaceae bacterium]